MEKEYVVFDATNIKQNLSKMDLYKIQNKKEFCEKKLAENVFPVQLDNEKWYEKDYFVSLLNAIEQEIANRTYTQNETETAQETDVPATVVEVPIPTIEKETDTGTSNTDETNVKKVLHKKSPKTIDKSNKINYINNTNETTTNNSKGETTMENTMKNEIHELLTLVKHLNARIESLELGNRPQLKKLREKKEEAPKKAAEKIVKKTAEKTAVTNEKQELIKLQKKARESEKTLTKKQMGEYTKLITEKCREINKTFAKTDKSARSMAFVKARISCLKKARAI